MYLQTRLLEQVEKLVAKNQSLARTNRTLADEVLAMKVELTHYVREHLREEIFPDPDSAIDGVGYKNWEASILQYFDYDGASYMRFSLTSRFGHVVYGPEDVLDLPGLARFLCRYFVDSGLLSAEVTRRLDCLANRLDHVVDVQPEASGSDNVVSRILQLNRSK